VGGRQPPSLSLSPGPPGEGMMVPRVRVQSHQSLATMLPLREEEGRAQTFASAVHCFAGLEQFAAIAEDLVKCT
jgi:hypothetical protein